MSLAPLPIATKGYVCANVPNDIAIATKGYVCLGIAPPDRRDGDGGHGAVIWEPRQFRREDFTEIEILAILAIFAIDETDG